MGDAEIDMPDEDVKAELTPGYIPILEEAEAGQILSEMVVRFRGLNALISVLKKLDEAGARLVSGFLKKLGDFTVLTSFVDVSNLNVNLDELKSELTSCAGVERVEFTHPSRVAAESLHFPKYVQHGVRVIVVRIKDIEAAWRFLPVGAAARLYQQGVECGRESYRVLSRVGLDMNEMLKLREQVYRAAGWALVNFVDVDPGKGVGTVIVKKSFEVDALKDRFPGRKLCNFIRGHMAGFLSCLFGRDVVVEEVQCEGEGAGYCRFIIKPKEMP